MKAYFRKRTLKFNKPAGTSRGVLLTKPSWYIFLYDEENTGRNGLGEVSIVPGLSVENEQQIETKLSEICAAINAGTYEIDSPLLAFPSIKFGLEMALLDYQVKGSKILFQSDFTEGIKGIRTNGLIWMAPLEEMYRQVEQKLDAGFRCLKMKIGAIDIQQELEILTNLRQKFSSSELEIRVDANGAFSYEEAGEILAKLNELEVHSIEQPIAAGQPKEMASLCKNNAIPIALDEELIGIYSFEQKKQLIEQIKPRYLILKPSLLGGFNACTEWIRTATELGVGWWATSALESNIGLNAIAQWIATFDTEMYQGLGLGNLYEENVGSPLVLRSETLFYDTNRKWNFEFIS
ncbi:o-succinylbenzoate synthase [Prolixibacteraceae bacterium Z1-6]|uniref:O-succinylbenzoate synthase n=1 Tax=Draconibacterium aestuarii TaxID=2998507 RepID=A0A9X3F4Z8_9BACT|nr:o-succinylbenzoate synthase [Prolixibacteraceae bacterium Z1-6]